MKIVYLAAGTGNRMLPYTKDKPKCFLNINDKFTILSKFIYQTKNLKNLKNIILATGYKSFKFKSFIGNNIIRVNNRKYLSTNMLYTLYKCIKHLNEPFLIVYSDIIFSNKILSKMVQCSINKKDICVAVDKDWKKIWKFRYGKVNYDLESLKINKKNEIFDIGNKVNNYKDIDARYIGIISVPKEQIINFKAQLNNIYEKKMSRKEFRIKSNLYFTDFLNYLLSNKTKIKAISFSNGWYEFDEKNDYRKFLRNNYESKVDLGV